MQFGYSCSGILGETEIIFILRCSDHPNADSYRDLTPKQIYKKHENEKKRQSGEKVMEIEQGTLADECMCQVPQQT